MADYTVRSVRREFTEWSIPVRSLGSLSEWDELHAAIIAVVGGEKAEQHGVLVAAIDGDDDDPVLTLSFEHAPGQRIEWGPPATLDSESARRPRGDSILTARDVVELGRMSQPGIAVASLSVAQRLAALVGDKTASDSEVCHAVDGVPVMLDGSLPDSQLRIGEQVYRLECNGRAYLTEAWGQATPPRA